MLILAATRDGGQLLMYPRAAIRQSMQLLTSKAFYPRFDIELQFNSQWSWDFGEPGQSNVEFSRFYRNCN